MNGLIKSNLLQSLTDVFVTSLGDAEVLKYVAASSRWENATDSTGGVQNKFDATTAPIGTDDSSAGYSVGSTWIDVTADDVYRCVDASVGSAVWEQINDNDLLDKLDATTAPAVTDDSSDGYGVGSTWVDVTADEVFVCVDASVGSAVWEQTNAAGGGGGLNNLVEDLSPELGDDLNVNGHQIIASSGGTIGIAVLGNGSIQLSVGASGTISLSTGTSGTATVSAPTISLDSDGGSIALGGATSPDIVFHGQYTFPTADGTSGDSLKTDGTGNLYWGT